MKKILSLLAIGVFALNSGAIAQDAKAQTVLSAVTKKMSGMKSAKASFTLTMTTNGRGTAKKGTFLMKGDKYMVTVDKQQIYCDGHTVWTYNSDAKEVQISTYDPNEQTISPSKLFTNFYDKEYTYKYTGTRKVSGKDCDVIELTPIAKNKSFTKVELCIDKNSTIAAGTIFQKNGQRVTYVVSGLTPNATVTDASFVFNTKAHPGVEVVDMR